MRSSFLYGDDVVASCRINESISKGCKGRVCDILNGMESSLIGVRWEIPFNGGHDCCGTCDDGHGWYSSSNSLTLISDSDEENETGCCFDNEDFVRMIGWDK